MSKPNLLHTARLPLLEGAGGSIHILAPRPQWVQRPGKPWAWEDQMLPICGLPWYKLGHGTVNRGPLIPFTPGAAYDVGRNTVGLTPTSASVTCRRCLNSYRAAFGKLPPEPSFDELHLRLYERLRWPAKYADEPERSAAYAALCDLSAISFL